MKNWADGIISAEKKKALPILSFPGIQLTGITVKELIASSELQAKTMRAVADRVDSAASVSMMDLSVEAEAFGSQIMVSDYEVPTVFGNIVMDMESAEALEIPKIGAGRTGIYLEAAEKAAKLITDRPVFSGVIGPYSLAGRLIGVSDIMMECYSTPEMVELVMDKTTEFLINYINAYKQTGVGGVCMAEPLTGMLSPKLAEIFSAPYVKRVIDAVQSDDFAVIYHNCGDNTPYMAESIVASGAMAYHFGNAVNMKEMLEKMPGDKLVMGNISPSEQLLAGTPETVRAATLALLENCSGHANYVISTGCDVPPKSSWENIDAFFAAAAEFYGA